MGDATAGPWWERCEWNDQDATRTLRHVDDLLAGWTVELPAAATELPAVQGAIARVETIARTWEQEPQRRIAHARDLFAQLTTIDDLRRSVEAPTPRRGRIERINASSGGVPKRSVGTAEVGWRGIAGDVQRTRLHHGRPWQALSLWSSDVIDRLAADGHPVTPGAAGENLSIRGIDWSTLHAGAIVDIGAVRCQLTAPAVPCSKVASNFLGGDFSLIDHDVHPGSSRWYAAVLVPGAIAADDPLTVT